MAPYWRLGFLFGVAIFSINSDALVIIEPADISGRYLPTPEFACIPDTIQGVTGSLHACTTMCLLHCHCF
jgi:hypothetical protein